MKGHRRVALKIAYDGSEFYGFQRQPERPTVEGALIDALESIGAIDTDRECGFRSSSRTDRGVSALGNVVSFNTGFALESLCPALNSELRSVWAYSAVNVDDDFNPRYARQRWYRYYLPRASQNLSLMNEAASRFVGTHDFSGFARLDGRSPIRTIDSIEISTSRFFHLIDFRAESFLWNMVRRMVWYIEAVGMRSIRPNDCNLDAGRKPRRVGLAPPEFLLLMDVDCGIKFPVEAKVARALQQEHRSRITVLEMDREISRQLELLLKGDGVR